MLKKGTTAEAVKADLLNQLEILQRLLPLREPDAENKKRLYKIIVRTLAHEWDKIENHKTQLGNLEQNYTYGSIMQCVRNWSAHTNLFDNLEEQHVAYFILIAMRVTYRLNDIEPYEHWLLSLLSDTPAPALDENQIKQHLCDTYAQLLQHYSTVLTANKKLEPMGIKQLDFIAVLKRMQYEDQSNQHGYDFLNALFNLFWHGFSPIQISDPDYQITPTQIHNTASYQLTVNDYGQNDDPFRYQLACALMQRISANLSNTA